MGENPGDAFVHKLLFHSTRLVRELMITILCVVFISHEEIIGFMSMERTGKGLNCLSSAFNFWKKSSEALNEVT